MKKRMENNGLSRGKKPVIDNVAKSRLASAVAALTSPFRAGLAPCVEKGPGG
jgi:hypothetical protein